MSKLQRLTKEDLVKKLEQASFKLASLNNRSMAYEPMRQVLKDKLMNESVTTLRQLLNDAIAKIEDTERFSK